MNRMTMSILLQRIGQHRQRGWLCAILLGVGIALLAACSRQAEDASAKPVNALAPAYIALARGRVDVEGGVQRITAPRDGVLAKLGAEVGDAVRPGQVLALLDTQQAELAQALAQAEASQAQAQADAQKARLPLLLARAERLRQAATAGALSEDKADEADQAILELKAEQRISAAAVATAQRRLAQASVAVDLSTVRAPVGGRILERHARTGENVALHAPLFTLRPARPLVVRAELNEALVDRVKTGMRAEIVSVNDDKVLSVARVLRLGEMFSTTRLVEVPGENVDTRSVECLLRLDADSLRIGMPVLVRFLP
ncbi:MAG: HlyD family efflux transporter periplasmic adaptor subunit [Betaproteobacteria bacterium]|nr:HlyD family efflux transporter periplasmic adaptor subunit [Betaproteobacteria bacterium]